MKNFYNETMCNAEEYYRNSSHSYTAKMFDGEGFTSRFETLDRTYFVATKIDKDANLVVMEVSPSIYCPKESRSMVGEYIDKVNTTYKCGNLHVDLNGNLYVQTEQRFDDAPLSTMMFRIMEGECIKILDTFEVILDKLAHMKLLEPDEADVEKVIKNHCKSMMNLARDMFNKPLFDDDDDDGDDDGDDDCYSGFGIPEPPGFSDWLRRKAESGDLIAERLLAKRISESCAEAPDEDEDDFFDEPEDNTDEK